MEKLSVTECISFGWTTFKARPWIFLGAGVILLVLNAAVSLPDNVFQNHPHVAVIAVNGVMGIISMIVSVYVAIGARHFILKAHDDVTTVTLKDLLHLRMFWSALAVQVITAVLVFIGIIALIIPGIILGLGWWFAFYLVVDRELGPIDALKESWRITKGNRWNLFLLALAVIGINLVGLIALLVGILVTIPVTALASVHAYRTLSSMKNLPEVIPASEDTVAIAA